MANPAITRASVRAVLVRANGETLQPARICALLGVDAGIAGDAWQNVCEVIWHGSRMVELGVASTKPTGGYFVTPQREAAA